MVDKNIDHWFIKVFFYHWFTHIKNKKKTTFYVGKSLSMVVYFIVLSTVTQWLLQHLALQGSIVPWQKSDCWVQVLRPLLLGWKVERSLGRQFFPMKSARDYGDLNAKDLQITWIWWPKQWGLRFAIKWSCLQSETPGPWVCQSTPSGDSDTLSVVNLSFSSNMDHAGPKNSSHLTDFLKFGRWTAWNIWDNPPQVGEQQSGILSWTIFCITWGPLWRSSWHRERKPCMLQGSVRDFFLGIKWWTFWWRLVKFFHTVWPLAFFIYQRRLVDKGTKICSMIWVSESGITLANLIFFIWVRNTWILLILPNKIWDMTIFNGTGVTETLMGI